MTTIRLHNTRTRKREDFVPISADDVRMYVCGPTVYDRAHIGNARPVIVFDVLYRLLRHVYGAGHVSYVRNFTDVDDKINARAAENGQPIAEITAKTTRWFLEDMAAIGALEPSLKGAEHDRAMPRATAYIDEMIAMIQDLVSKDHAYAAEGHVLFRVRSYAEYGALSGRSVDDMIAGARVEVAPYKEDPLDFVLWKPSDDATPGWDSPWGRGRPGWHIECSAMAEALLGDTFDIHGGGNDLTFPHHENEIAQSKCAGHGFANVWMHNEMLQVEGRKMSKSLGNFFTVRDLLDQGVPGEVIRFVFLSTHYRKPMDWTEKKREEAEKKLDRLAKSVRIAIKFLGKNGGLVQKPTGLVGDVPPEVSGPLLRDLDTYGALSGLQMVGDMLLEIETGEISGGSPQDLASKFLNGTEVLGFFELLLKRQAEMVDRRDILDPIETRFLVHYLAAKQTKDFSEVDNLKSALIAAGVEVRISKDNVELIAGSDFDPSKLEALK